MQAKVGAPMAVPKKGKKIHNKKGGGGGGGGRGIGFVIEYDEVIQPQPKTKATQAAPPSKQTKAQTLTVNNAPATTSSSGYRNGHNNFNSNGGGQCDNQQNVKGGSQEFEFDDIFSSGGTSPFSVNQSLLSLNIKKNRDTDDNKENNTVTQETVKGISSLSITETGVDDDDDVLYPNQSKVSLEDFELLRLVGKGGYGKVYQAKKKGTEDIYAIKVLRKDFLLKTHNVEYTKKERDILRRVRFPFIVSLHYAFQNEGKVYLVMDWVNGGQLLFHLREQAMFSESTVKFYIAEIVLAIEHLHSLQIIHRDLKPENILLDSEGHISVTDFGLAKDMLDSSAPRTFCGTAEYMAPEMISAQPYGKSVDWWSVGILAFDLLNGEPPFRSKNEKALFDKILKEKIRWPSYLTSEAISLIKGFLNRDDKIRLGSGPDGIKNIKTHPWFKGVNWNKVAKRTIDPPYKPNCPKGELDVSNFDKEFTDQPPTESPCGVSLTGSQERLFDGFSYVRSPVLNSPL